MKIYLRYMFVLLIALRLVVPSAVGANSGPTFWQGYPSTEVLTVDEDCPIEVAGEKLSFDFSDGSIHHHTIRGKVTAAYEMVNPTEHNLSVQMAFPFITSLREFSGEDIVITCDGRRLPYDLYIGEVINSRGNPFQEETEEDLAFENILSIISNHSYQTQHFSENEKGLLYTLEVKPTTDEQINFAVDFEFYPEKTKILANGFNSYEGDGRKVRIASWCYEPEKLEIFILGDKPDFNIAAYTDGGLKKETDLYTYKISSQEIELQSYLKKYINEYREKFVGKQLDDSVLYALDGVQFYNLYGAALDRAFTVNDGFCSGEELMGLEHYDRVFTLVYNVEFPAHSQKSVVVNYKTSGTMDRTRTTNPVYSFNYLLNPAQNWKSFKNLDIEIITPKEAPYIVESSLEFNKEKERHYRASFDSLPEGDLSFSIYENEQISFLDKILGVINKSIAYFWFLGIFGGIVVVFGLVIALIIKQVQGRF